MTTRRLFGLLSILILLLTSQSMAIARGASAETGQMVICTGTGPQIVYVDAEGQPTPAPHLCPDAALELPADLAVPAAASPAPVSWPSKVAPVGAAFAPSLPDPGPPARAPPVLV